MTKETWVKANKMRRELSEDGQKSGKVNRINFRDQRELRRHYVELRLNSRFVCFLNYKCTNHRKNVS